MNSQKIVDYAMNTPHNINPVILKQMIDENTGGGSNDPGSSEEWIGDGNTHIWITLPEGRTSPMLGVCPNGTVTVDWGDGSEPDVLTGTDVSTYGVQWTPTHNYAKSGDYVITLTVDGEIVLYGSNSSNQNSGILRYSLDSDTRNRVYQSAVKRVEIGDGVTSIGTYAFSYCYALTSITIPDSVTTISNSVFSYCCAARYFDFTNHTTVPILSHTNAFSNTPPDFEIRVPEALYDKWITATNWATYASQIVAV